MRLYQATLYESRSKVYDPQPVRFEGNEVSREIAAESAGKARYRFWIDLRDAWGDDVRLQDIRVRSLSKSAPRHLDNYWEERLHQANSIIRVIGSHGRRFLSENSDRRTPVENPFFAHFTVDSRREIWFVDRYSRKPILVRHKEWNGFSDGGTLRSVVESLANYIRGGYEVPMRMFGPWPEWICGGDLWAYGDDMQKVRDGIAAILAPAVAA